MSIQKMKLQLNLLQAQVENLDFLPLLISSLSPRVLRDHLMEANNIISTLIEKVVGRERVGQATFLLQQLGYLKRRSKNRLQ